VLLCTTYQRFPGDYYDVAGRSIYSFIKLTSPRKASLGLRFIKQNVPEVEILEFPSWNEYVEKLKEGWDVVGFSFLNIELDEIEKMMEEARSRGVREIWAGNYGALDDRIPGMADRIFIGPAETEIAPFFGYRINREDVEHPAMTCRSYLYPGRIPFQTIGILYTYRGCPFKCTYCQSTVFNKECYPVNFESIERAVLHYKKIGITYIACLDETFGACPEFTDRITELFARHKMNWWAQSRVGVALRDLDVWCERGLRVVAVGVESMTQSTLNAVNKQQGTEEVVEFARRIGQKRRLARMGYYQMGFPNMTADDIVEDATRFSELEFDVVTVGTITPHPKTPLWAELESKYGIFDRTNRHYNNSTLVWNHPYITPEEMKELKVKLLPIVNKPDSFFRLASRGFRPPDVNFVWSTMVKGSISSWLIGDRKQVFFPRLGH
jgi:radical SAM superfamily enzyme YgiQ (UPF0313 family)